MALLAKAVAALSQLEDARAFQARAAGLLVPAVGPARSFVELAFSVRLEGEAVSPAVKQAVSRKVTAVARSLARMATCPPPPPPTLHSLIFAASYFLRGASILARHCRLPAAVFEELCGAMALLFRHGLSRHGCRLPGPASATPAEHAALTDVRLMEGTNSPTEDVSVQMDAMGELEDGIREQHLDDVLARFAAGTAAPQHFLPWLSACAELLLESAADPPHESEWAAHRLTSAVIAPLLVHPAFAQHRDAVEGDPRVQQRLAALLLRSLQLAAFGPRGLPAHGEATSGQGTPGPDLFFLDRLLSAVTVSCLQGGLRRQMQQAGSTPALEAVAQLCEQVPLPQADSASASTSTAAAEGSMGGCWGPEVGWKVRCCAVQLFGTLADLLPMHGWSDEQLPGSVPPPAPLQQAAALAVLLVPYAAGVLRFLSSQDGRPSLDAMSSGKGDGMLVTLTQHCHYLFHATARVAPALTSVQQLREWCAAGDAQPAAAAD